MLLDALQIVLLSLSLWLPSLLSLFLFETVSYCAALADLELTM